MLTTPCLSYALALGLTITPPGEPVAHPDAAHTVQAAKSELELKLEVSPAMMTAALERMLADGARDGVVYAESGIGAPLGTLELTITRAGAIHTTVLKDGSLAVEVPLKVKARLDFKILRMKHHEEVEGSLTVRGEIQADVKPDWRLTTRSTLGFTWNSAPTLRGVSLGSVAGELVQRQLDRLASAIDAKLPQQMDLRALAERGWQTAHQPIALAPGIWLLARPESARLYGPHGGAQALVFGFGVTGDLAVTSGPAPSVQPAPQLPALARAQGEPGRLDLRARHELALKDLADAIGRQTANNPLRIEFAGMQVDVGIDSLDLHAINGAVGFTATVAFGAPSLQVRLFVSGALRADPAVDGLGVRVDDYRVGFTEAARSQQAGSQVSLAPYAALLRTKIGAWLTALADRHGVRLDVTVGTLQLQGLHAVGGRVSFVLELTADLRTTPQ